MKLITINSKEAPKAIGPYSQAIRTGDLLFTSGQIAIDPKTNEFISEGIEKQTELVLKNLEAVLKEGGSSLKSVVKTTVFIKSMKDFPVINSIYEKFFLEHKPARSTVEVASLPKGALIEIEAVASIKGN